MKALWNGATIAESDQTVEIEGNHYFPPQSVRQELLKASSTTSVCPWKGKAQYYSVVVRGQRKPGCGMVLSESQRGCCRNKRPCGLLARN
jgi:uncharacterized protein (DUF427 family)